MASQRLFALATAFWALLYPIAGSAQELCRPAIGIKSIHFSEVVNLKRYWTAAVNVDTSTCATWSGLFSVSFVRLSETAPDLEFAEPFLWRSGQKWVRVEFRADEAVDRYWIADVAPCPCRNK